MVELQLASGQQNNNLQTAAVVALGKPTELRDEDIIESVHAAAATTVATTTANSNVITLTSPDQTFTKTIVIENFSDHPPEMQKDILNAILNSDVGCGASAATAPSGETVATTVATLQAAAAPPPPQPQPPPIVEAQPISLAQEPAAAAVVKQAEPAEQPEEVKAEGKSEEDGGDGAAAAAQVFPPITVSEFEGGDGGAAEAAHPPAEDLTTS